MTTFTIAGVADWIGADGNPLYFFYERLADVCTRCSDVMMLLAMVLAFAGLLLQVYRGTLGGDLSVIFKQLIMTGVVVSIMPFYAEWMLEAQHTLGTDLLVELGTDPISLLEELGDDFTNGPWDSADAPSIILGVIDPLAWFEYFSKLIGVFLMMIISVVMWIFFFIGFQIQIVAIYMGCSVGPLFLAMLLFEPTRDSGVKYHVGMIGICFWPLGWGLGMLFGQAMLEAGSGLISAIMVLVIALFPFNSLIAGALEIILLLVVILWFIVVLFAAPKIVQKAVTTGAQIGMGFVGAGAATASAGIQAASGAALAAGGAAATVATGGAAAPAALGAASAGMGAMTSAAKTAASAGD